MERIHLVCVMAGKSRRSWIEGESHNTRTGSTMTSVTTTTRGPSSAAVGWTYVASITVLLIGGFHAMAGLTEAEFAQQKAKLLA